MSHAERIFREVRKDNMRAIGLAHNEGWHATWLLRNVRDCTRALHQMGAVGNRKKK